MSNPTSAPPRPLPPGMQLPQRSVGLKLLIVCALALLMAIPSLFVYEIVRERRMGGESATAMVSEAMGGRQTAMGPVIAVPYSRTPDPKHPETIIYAIAYAYAETGSIDAEATVTEKIRSIHSIPVYDTTARFTAVFDPNALRKAIPADASPIWSSAYIYMGLTEFRGAKDGLNLSANGKALTMEPVQSPHSNNPADFKEAPYYTGLSLAGSKFPELETLKGPLEVSAKTRFTGAEHLNFPPFAKDTTINLKSNWNDPSFDGTVLPTEHTATPGTTDGFTATWRVPYIARNVAGSGADLDIEQLTDYNSQQIGVRFMVDVGPYQSVERALKYALMFVGFVFLAYFLFEVSSNARAHPAQYLLVGLAQTIFYLLLLALSERIGFDLSFFIAALLTVSLTAAYAMSVFQSRAYGLRAFGILSGIYGLSYVLMRAEDNALLAGAFASFTAIAITMYITRNIDWYGNKPTNGTA